MPFAAFFVAVCLLLCIPDRTRKALLCLLLGGLTDLLLPLLADNFWALLGIHLAELCHAGEIEWSEEASELQRRNM